MYFLESICAMESLDPVWNIIGFIVKAIWIGIPIILIVLGMLDLGKAVIASDEKEVQKATKTFGKRFLYAVAVFLVVWLVQFVLSTVADVADGAINYNEDSWTACWAKIVD